MTLRRARQRVALAVVGMVLFPAPLLLGHWGWPVTAVGLGLLYQGVEAFDVLDAASQRKARTTG